MDLNVELVDIDTLISDPQNVRLHNERNRDAVQRSIKQFGIRKPIVAHAKTNIVYAGNLTLECARELGRKQIPVAWIPADVPESVCRAYGIADNKTSDLSAFDDERLKEALRTLSDIPEIDIESVGFTQSEVDALLASVDDLTLDTDDESDSGGTMHTAVRDILIENVAAIPEGTVAILLSGGIDSTAVALALRLAGKEPIAYTFTLDGHISTDFSCARYNARRLGIPFVPVFLPTDIEGTYQDIVTLIRDFGCASKASIECNWCFLHAVRQIKEAAIATGLGADLYFAVRRSERQHLSKNPVAFDRHRIRTFDDPAHGGISGLTCICESHGKRLYRPFYDRRLLALFVGKSWQALNRPRQKAPLWAAFAKELRGLKVKRHANLQAGDTNIREHFERVAAHVAPGVGMVKFYNTLRRDYGSERSDVTTGALGI